MANSFRDKRRHRLHRAIAEGRLAELPYEEKVRVTGTLTHNWKQEMKRERRTDQRADSRRLVRENS